MSKPEFAFPIDVRQTDGLTVDVAANKAERTALAKRFDLVRIDRLEAHLELTRKGKAVEAMGTLRAVFVQSCAASAEDLPQSVCEDIALRFIPASAASPTTEEDIEIEIDAEQCDEIEYHGTTIDLGEAVAQSLALAIDPFATGPDAETARSLFGKDDSSPFAALAALKTDKSGDSDDTET